MVFLQIPLGFIGIEITEKNTNTCAVIKQDVICTDGGGGGGQVSILNQCTDNI